MEERDRKSVMMKKNKQIYHADLNCKTLIHKTHLNDKSLVRSEINTERSKGRMSKSPLKEIDTNRIKNSNKDKSSMQTQKSVGLIKKVQAIHQLGPSPYINMSN